MSLNKIFSKMIQEQKVLQTTAMKPLVSAVKNRNPITFFYSGQRKGKNRSPLFQFFVFSTQKTRALLLSGQEEEV